MIPKKPYGAMLLLTLIFTGCLFAGVITSYDPQYMDLKAVSLPPDAQHLFGTDPMGRDLFSVVWHGGRLSLFVGLLATLISTAIAILYGCLAGLASRRLDDLLMRLSELLMSIPQILLVIFLQAILGEPTAISIAVVLGITGWMAVAKMVRSEVKQLRSAEYVLAARTMEGGFFYILWNHLMPNFMPAIFFMIVSNLSSAIAAEATLSFLGIGLPTATPSWGSLMSLSQRAMLSGAWWMLIIPGMVLVITLVCITDIGEYLRKKGSREGLL